MHRHVLLDLGPNSGRLGVAVAPLEHRHDPLVAAAPGVARAFAGQLEGHLAIAAAVEDHLAHALRQLAPRLVEGEAELARQGGDHPHAPRLGARGPGGDSACLDRSRRIGDDLVLVDAHERAEPRARGARAVGTVEGEEPRRDLGQARAALRARVALRQRLLGEALRRDHHQAAAHLERGLDRVGEPALDLGLDHQPIDHDVDRVLLLLVELGRLAAQLDRLAVDAGTHEALPGDLLELLAVFALLAAHVGGVDHQPRAGGERQDAIDHLLHGLGANLVAAARAVRHADRRVEQPQVIVDLGDRSDRRARVLRHRLLLDRDGRREPLDRVDVGLLHLLEELPGVGRERLDVAALALGVEGVEGERRLARARHTGDDHQPVPRDLQGDVLEVVLARAAHHDRVHRGGILAPLRAARPMLE